MSTVEDYAAAQAAEYATFIATATITFNGAPAYHEGYPVPVSNVELHHYLEAGLVRRVDDPATTDTDSDSTEEATSDE